MAKQKATLYLERNIWLPFRAACIRRGVSASQALEDLMREDLYRRGDTGGDTTIRKQPASDDNASGGPQQNEK